MAKKLKKRKIALIIDKSGSMYGLRKSAISAINEQIGTIRRESGNIPTELTCIQFNTDVEPMFTTHAQSLRDIDKYQYNPTGGTALYDAINYGICRIEEDDKSVSHLVIVISDGEENSSKEINQSTLVEKIKKLEGKGNWSFVYMMSNVNIMDLKNKLNIHNNNISTWEYSNDGMIVGSANVARGVSTYLCSTDSGATNTANFFSGDTGTVSDSATISNSTATLVTKPKLPKVKK